MALRDDIELYIKQGGPRQPDELLEACFKDGSLEALLCVTRMFEDMYGGHTYNFELKAPAAWELACWGQRGIDQLVDTTLKATTSKNVSLCLDILSHFAAGDKFTVAPLERYRVEGTGPKFIKVGRGKRARVLYRLTDLRAWLDGSVYQSTSEYD